MSIKLQYKFPMYTAHPSHPDVRGSRSQRPPASAPVSEGSSSGNSVRRGMLEPHPPETLKVRQTPTESCGEFIDSNYFLLGQIELLKCTEINSTSSWSVASRDSLRVIWGLL